MSIPKSILAAALACFTSHPEEVEVHVTEDGNAWLGAHLNLAQTHASMAKLPAPVSVTRADVGLEAPARKVEAAEAATTEDETTEADDTAATEDSAEPLGSQEYGDTVSIKGKKVPMSDVVKHALGMTGLSVAQWNALEADERELSIDLAIEELKG